LQYVEGIEKREVMFLDAALESPPIGSLFGPFAVAAGKSSSKDQKCVFIRGKRPNYLRDWHKVPQPRLGTGRGD
jgi:hypothetical protein